MDLKKLISQEEYSQVSKPTWPIYQNFVNGATTKDSAEQNQIDDLVRLKFQDYYNSNHNDELADQNRMMQNQTFFDKKSKIPRHSMCRAPWETLGVNSYGDVFICHSPAWVPKFAGNINRVDDIYQVLNSDTAIKIRQEIYEGRYYYCNQQICGYLNDFPEGTIVKGPETPEDLEPLEFKKADHLLVNQIPKFLTFDFDHTCNYRCPSCRTTLINNKKHRYIRPINDLLTERIKRMIIDKIEDQPILIRWCGGEPFISDAYSDLLDYISKTKKTNIRHCIQTNGSYLKRKGDIVEALLPQLKELRISIDAATAESYHKIRVNGVWDNLLENISWVVDKIKQSNYNVELSGNFVVQLGNYKEIPQFAKLCRELGLVPGFQRMWDWYTWPKEEFNRQNVWHPDHPEYNTVLELLEQAKNEFAAR